MLEITAGGEELNCFSSKHLWMQVCSDFMGRMSNGVDMIKFKLAICNSGDTENSVSFRAY